MRGLVVRSEGQGRWREIEGKKLSIYNKPGSCTSPLFITRVKKVILKGDGDWVMIKVILIRYERRGEYSVRQSG